MSKKDLFALPHDLPVPVDDGAAQHLWGARLPEKLELPATNGEWVYLGRLGGPGDVVGPALV